MNILFQVCRKAHNSPFLTGSWVMADATILWITPEWPYQISHHSPHGLLTLPGWSPWPYMPFQLRDPTPSSRPSMSAPLEPFSKSPGRSNHDPLPNPVSQHSPPFSLCSSYTGFLELPTHAKPAPASGPLHQLFSLPKMHFPQIASCLPLHLHYPLAQMSSS